MKLPIFNTTRPLAPSINRLQNEGTAVEVVSRDLNSAPFNPSDAGDDALDGLRPLILDRLLWAAVLLGVLASALIMPRLLENGLLTTSLLTSPYGMWLALYGIIWIALVFAAFRRQMGVAWRAALLLLALFSTGLALLLIDGLAGSGQVVLLVVPFIAAIISGARGRMIGLALSLGALILMVVLIATGIVPPTGLLTARDSLLYWILAILIFSLLAISGVIALGLLVNGTQASLSHLHALSDELDNELARSEALVADRSDDLRRRLIQIRTVAEINRAVSRVLDIDQLLPQICELVRQRFDLYYVGIFLIEQVEPRELLHPVTDQDLHQLSDEDQTGESKPTHANYAILKAGTGEAGRRMLSEGHKLAVGGDSMIGWATANRQPRIALNVGQQNWVDVIGRFDNPHLPLTRSELALPILAGELGSGPQDPADEGQDIRVLGAMTIQSSQERAFDQDDIVILQGIADGLASAIENARLFQATQASLEEIRTLHRQYLKQAWEMETAQRGEIAYTYEDKTRAVFGAPTGDAAGGNGSLPRPEAQLEMPISLRDQVIGSLILEPGPGAAADEDSPQDWSAEELAFIEAVTNQASLALENARLLEETRRKVSLEHTAASITSKLWASSDIETILRIALQELGASLGARDGSIELWSAEARPGSELPDERQAASRPQSTQEVADAAY